MGSGGFLAGIRETRDPLDSSVEFLASEKYITKRGGITLDAALFTADEDGNKIVEGGTPLGKVDATGLYGPVDSAATDGRATAVGLLFPGNLNLAYGNVSAALLLHGSVLEARCPTLTQADKDALSTRIIFQ